MGDKVADSDPIALPILKVQEKDGTWTWITDIKGVSDLGMMEPLEVESRWGKEHDVYETSRVLELHRLSGVEIHCFLAKRIYLCNGITGSTIDCLS